MLTLSPSAVEAVGSLLQSTEVPDDAGMRIGAAGESQFTMTTTGQMLARLQADRAPDDLAVIPIYDLGATTP